jgi:eukaryotic-like serine/threonine-protein kinase
MSEISSQSFLSLLDKSGLIPSEQLQAELSLLRSKLQADPTTEALTEHLLRQGMVTQWHVEKLLTGKFRGFFLGKYKLLGLLGSGGMSSVYLAEHLLSGQKRAIKVLPKKRVSDKSYLDRFYLEARAAASLNHPNVVKIYDISNEAETHYMVMEYVQGQDLSDLVKDKGPLPIKEAVSHCVQAAEGLYHAHRRDLVHRDIKPANLILTDEGTIKILDLGLALVNQDETESLTLLYNDKVMGTADYLAPEQAVNSHLVDRRADIYSLGCTLYFLLTGHPPFPKGTLAQRIAMHQTQEPADIRESRPECPAELVAICKQMMMKKADARYQNCVDLKADLEGWLKSGKQLRTGLLPSAPIGQRDFTSEPDSKAPTSIIIDTSGSSKSERQGARKSRDSVSGSNAGEKKKPLSGKKLPSPGITRNPPPKWLMPVLILLMFVILLALLYFISRTINSPVQARAMQTFTAIADVGAGGINPNPETHPRGLPPIEQGV